MTDTALIEKGDAHASHWVRRTVLVGFCLILVGALGVVFTRVVAERVPEQRATLERLIAERTGLAVRFDNVHFAWGLDDGEDYSGQSVPNTGMHPNFPT